MTPMLRFWQRKRHTQRVLLLGLDCASPRLIFHDFEDKLPTFHRLMREGTWGELQSSLPCITVPAWSSMLSSRDPGVLGIYGFRNRADYSYDALKIADSAAVEQPRLWDLLSAANKTSLVLNVPQTYPVQALNGHLVSGFMTADIQQQFAYPAIFKQEVLKHFPTYHFDVRDFRKMDREALLQRLYELTDVQYDLLLYALKTKSWDFAMHVNIALDRLHHTFWRYHDPAHRLHQPDHHFQHAIRDYYQHLDGWLARILAVLDDDVSVIVASDHGVKRMDGAIAINEWLWREGWLTLKTEPDNIVPFQHDRVDWSHTRAWSTGGYYGRIFLNVAGREPQGIIPQADYDAVRDQLAAAIRAIPDDKGQALKTTVYKPEEIYQHVNNVAPDLLVYFGDLHWRAVGSLGYGQHYTLENDTGPDDANHAQEGLFLFWRPHQRGAGERKGQQLMDIAPTILYELGVAIPPEMQGTRIE